MRRLPRSSGAAPEEPGADLAATAAAMGRRHLRGSTLLLVGRLASLGFTVATQIIIVRAYSKTDFGGFALALSIASATRLLLSLGQGKTLSRFLAIYVERRDWGRLYGSVLIAVGTVLATGTVLIGALFVLRDRLVGPVVDDSGAATVLLIVVLLAPMEAIDQVFVSIFAVLTRPRAIFFRKYLFTPGLRLGVVTGVALTGGDIVALAVGYVAAQMIGLLVYLAMLRSVLGQQGLLSELRWSRLSWPVRSVFFFAVPMLSTELVFLSMNTGSVLVLNHYWDAAEVADLRAVVPAATLNKIFYTTFVTLYLPMASRLFARGDHAALRADYWRTAAFLAVASFPVFAMTGPFAPATTVFLFGERYESSAVVLAVLSVGYFLNSALGFNLVTLQAYGRVRFLLVVNLACAVGNLALTLVLVPEHGALGVAVASCATLVLQNLAYQVGLRRVLATSLIDRAYLWSYASLALATIVLVALQVAVRPGLVLGLVATALVTVALLAVNRRALALAESFPELARVPGVRWFATKPPTRAP